ncbi:hypothetical protein CFP56_016964 [Quercus suber]|uniref:DUF538 domain-containing protein n=1 Tax=Quercus suber TaxID=58331 RepID=A0AAW0KQ90_QUESU
MASNSITSRDQDERAGAEIVHGPEECYRHSIDLLEELGFPKGVLPLQDLEECGRVRETGFVWMKQKAPYEHFFVGSNTRDERAGAEIVHGPEECYRHSIDLLEELGFPKGVLPLQDLEECGRVRETGFVWMKQKAPYEHFFVGSNTRVSYSLEVTAYVEKFKMKKMTGIKSKQVFLWVPITEMSIDDPASKKIYFKTPMGIGKSFPVTAFMSEEEKQKYLEEKANSTK